MRNTTNDEKENELEAQSTEYGMGPSPNYKLHMLHFYI